MIMKWIASSEEVSPVICAFHFMRETFSIVEAQMYSGQIYEKAVMEFRKREHVTFMDSPVECF
jgi:hypothetical protein